MSVSQGIDSPAVTRLHPLDAAATGALARAARAPRRVAPRTELIAEGQEIRESLLLLGDWVAQVCDLPDGRRQILHLLLPGDLIGVCEHHRPLAIATAVALTEVALCGAPDPAASPALRRLYAQSRAHEQAHHLGRSPASAG